MKIRFISQLSNSNKKKIKAGLTQLAGSSFWARQQEGLSKPFYNFRIPNLNIEFRQENPKPLSTNLAIASQS